MPTALYQFKTNTSNNFETQFFFDIRSLTSIENLKVYPLFNKNNGFAPVMQRICGAAPDLLGEQRS